MEAPIRSPTGRGPESVVPNRWMVTRVDRACLPRYVGRRPSEGGMVRSTSARTRDPVGHDGKLPRGLEAEEEIPLVTIQDLCPDRTRLAEIARRHSGARLEVFGSFARSDAGPESDLDLLVTFEPGARMQLD